MARHQQRSSYFDWLIKPVDNPIVFITEHNEDQPYVEFPYISKHKESEWLTSLPQLVSSE